MFEVLMQTSIRTINVTKSSVKELVGLIDMKPLAEVKLLKLGNQNL